MRYLEDIAHKPSADDAAMHLDQLLPTIGPLPLEQVHDGTLKPFVDAETARGLAPKSVNNAIAVVSAVLNRAARVWRTDEGTPWLRLAPPRLSRLSTKGRSGKPYPLSWAEQDRLFRLLPRHLADAALFAVNTGCREQEICKLRWEWEVDIPEMETSVFILPESETKTRTERVVVLNSIASRVIASRRGIHEEYVFTYRGKPVGKLRSSAWRRAWEKAGLPMDEGILKGVHNLRHTFGRRLRGAGVTRETGKALFGHANGDITTHYSAAELGELLTAAEKMTDRGITQTPTLTVIRRTADKDVGKVSEKEEGLTA
jgi:integrase